MYSRPTTPATIGGVLDNIFKLYGAALPVCWPIALISALISLVPSLYVAMRFTGTDPTQALAMFASPLFWGSYVVLIVVSIVFMFAMLVRVAQVADGADGSTGEAIGRAFALLPRALGATLLYILIYLGGSLLLIIPGIIWSVSFLFAGAIIAVENAGVIESLSTSRRLVKGSWWRTFAILTIALIVAYLLLFTVQFISGIVGALLTADPITVAIVSTVLGALLNVVVAPLYSAAILGIYFDLKLRKEGDDLADRVASLGQAVNKA